jgi:hypothetical protein
VQLHCQAIGGRYPGQAVFPNQAQATAREPDSGSGQLRIPPIASAEVTVPPPAGLRRLNAAVLLRLRIFIDG